MHINVRSILAEDLGFRQTFTIDGEQPEFDQIVNTEPINGTFTVTRLEDGVGVNGEVSTALELECHRCLRTFSRPAHIRFNRAFSSRPGIDDLPISEHDTIDLGELVQQELLVDLPIKILCQPDCPGIALPDSAADDTTPTVGDTARITKGS